MNLSLHLQRGNMCRRYMASRLLEGFPHDPWAGRCRSVSWDRRGKGEPGYRAQRRWADKLGRQIDRKRACRPAVRALAQMPACIRRTLTARSTLALLDAQQGAPYQSIASSQETPCV